MSNGYNEKLAEFSIVGKFYDEINYPWMHFLSCGMSEKSRKTCIVSCKPREDELITLQVLICPSSMHYTDWYRIVSIKNSLLSLTETQKEAEFHRLIECIITISWPFNFHPLSWLQFTDTILIYSVRAVSLVQGMRVLSKPSHA